MTATPRPSACSSASSCGTSRIPFRRSNSNVLTVCRQHQTQQEEPSPPKQAQQQQLSSSPAIPFVNGERLYLRRLRAQRLQRRLTWWLVALTWTVGVSTMPSMRQLTLEYTFNGDNNNNNNNNEALEGDDGESCDSDDDDDNYGIGINAVNTTRILAADSRLQRNAVVAEQQLAYMNTTRPSKPSTTTTLPAEIARRKFRRKHREFNLSTISFWEVKSLKDPFGLGRPFRITEGQHVSSPRHVGNCSCWNLTAECCHRHIHPNHKFGHDLVDSLFGAETAPYHFPELMPPFTGNYLPLDKYFRRGKDYREVFVVRNWFDALVSGYLYHKSGKECWLDPYGRRLTENDRIWAFLDHRFMDLVHLQRNGAAGAVAPPPAVADRSLCLYLADESEYTGMRVYAEWILRRFYMRFVRIFRAVQKREDERHRRTLFVCFEDLAHPATKNATIIKIIQWLYPGGQYRDRYPEIQLPAPAPEAAVASLKKLWQNSTSSNNDAKRNEDTLQLVLPKWKEQIGATDAELLLLLQNQSNASSESRNAEHNEKQRRRLQLVLPQWKEQIGATDAELLRLLQRQTNSSGFQNAHHQFYSGGHATTQDPALRTRLRQTAEKIDRELFHNTIRRASKLFGCGKH